MAIMRVTPPPTTVRTGTRCLDAGASDTRGRRSGTPRLQIPQPDQVIGGGGEGELPIHQGDAAMPELAQAADGLHPAEDLFHEFSFPLTHVIARMPRGPTVDRTPAGSGLASELRAQGDFLSVAACEVRPEARKPVTHVHGP